MTYQRRIYVFVFDSDLSPIIADTHQPMTSKLFRKIRSMVRTQVRRRHADFKCQFWRAYVQDDTNVFPYVWHIECGRDPNNYDGDIIPDYFGRYYRTPIESTSEYMDYYSAWSGYPFSNTNSSCNNTVFVNKTESEVQNPS